MTPARLILDAANTVQKLVSFSGNSVCSFSLSAALSPSAFGSAVCAGQTDRSTVVPKAGGSKMAILAESAFTSSCLSLRQLIFPFLQKFWLLAQFYFLQDDFPVHSWTCVLRVFCCRLPRKLCCIWKSLTFSFTSPAPSFPSKRALWLLR